jgi:hypothetical protein
MCVSPPISTTKKRSCAKLRLSCHATVIVSPIDLVDLAAGCCRFGNSLPKPGWADAVRAAVGAAWSLSSKWPTVFRIQAALPGSVAVLLKGAIEVDKALSPRNLLLGSGHFRSVGTATGAASSLSPMWPKSTLRCSGVGEVLLMRQARGPLLFLLDDAGSKLERDALGDAGKG